MSALLEVRDLRVGYGRRGRDTVVDGVDLTVREGETVGLIGESGSGKTTIMRAVLGLLRPAAGRIMLDGTDVTAVPAERRRDSGRILQAVFQDPYSSLSPARTIGQILTEPLVSGRRMSRGEARAVVGDLLGKVGLPADTAERYPHQFSGGQRQRIAIARALAVSPRLLICDEPVSALDVSVQAQVLRLLEQLRDELGIAYLFIGHNLAVVRQVCRTVHVLYRGRVLESGPAETVIARPLHPYTQALVAAVLVPDVVAQRSRREARTAGPAAGSEPAPADSVGCSYAARCPFAEPVCAARRPELRAVPGASVACHLYDPLSGHSGSGRQRQEHAQPRGTSLKEA